MSKILRIAALSVAVIIGLFVVASASGWFVETLEEMFERDRAALSATPGDSR